jgi:DNA-binding MarR family transcriptional regulator
VLLALRGLPEDVEPSVQALADQMVLKHHTVVELLDRLESGGLVRRERAADDRRRAQIAITARGAELLSKLSDSHLDELRLLAPELVGALHGVLRASRRSVAS